MFIGEYHHDLDDEGRLTLPARWRERLGLQVVVTRGLDRCLFVFAADKFESFARQISQFSPNKSDARLLSRYFFSKATTVEPDKQATITLSPDLRAFAGLSREAVIVGVNDRIEIWNPQIYSQAEEALMAEAAAASERIADALRPAAIP